jgi:ADP-ribose pyrophosphatase
MLARMDDEHLRETTIDQRVVHRGRFITFRVDTIVDPQGKEHRREIVEHPGAVCVIPVHGSDVLLVRQYRAAVGSVVLELPAGTLDHLADGSIEDPARAAPRELAEETGYQASTWRDLGRFWTAPGFTNERMHLYLASGLEALEDYRGPDEDEYLDLIRMPRHEAVRMAEAGAIEDAKTIIGLLQLARLDERGELD